MKNQVIAALKWPSVQPTLLAASGSEIKVSCGTAATPTFFAKETTFVASNPQNREFRSRQNRVKDTKR